MTFDRYIKHRYNTVPGMSSVFSALVCSSVMRLQTKEGWRGNVAEIGAFEGRFIIALALSLNAGEKAVAIDLFNWPDHGVKDRLVARLEKYRLSKVVEIQCADSRTLADKDILSTLSEGTRIRFFHIDGDHQKGSLVADMGLAFRCMEDSGVVCLDDMLSPAYPELVTVVLEVLRDNCEWVVFCVIDREDIVASTKFLICKQKYARFYIESLAFLFERNVWRMGAHFETHKALVLSPNPKLLRFNVGGTMSLLSYRNPRPRVK